MGDPEARLEALRRGDEPAWRQLMTEHGALVLYAARRVGLTGQDAEDVFQTAMLSAYRAIASLRSADRLASWLYRIAQRAAIDHLRARRPNVGLDDLAPLVDPSESVTDALERLDDARRLRHAIESLDDRCRALLTALYLEDPRPSYREIAERLETAVGSIGPTQARCLAKLEKSLDHVSKPRADRSSPTDEGAPGRETTRGEHRPMPGTSRTRRSERR